MKEVFESLKDQVTSTSAKNILNRAYTLAGLPRADILGDLSSDDQF